MVKILAALSEDLSLVSYLLLSGSQLSITTDPWDEMPSAGTHTHKNESL